MSNVEISGNLLRGENWERILKFSVLNVAAAIAIGLILLLVFSVFSFSTVVNIGVITIAVLIVNAVVLSSYEKWRGCNIV